MTFEISSAILHAGIITHESDLYYLEKLQLNIENLHFNNLQRTKREIILTNLLRDACEPELELSLLSTLIVSAKAVLSCVGANNCEYSLYEIHSLAGVLSERKTT